jgi:ATP-binding cassette, subfamily D (ALD), peroxisomal long-chain fatty acid import protein
MSSAVATRRPNGAALRRYGMYLVAVAWVIWCFLRNTGGTGGKKSKRKGAAASGKAIDIEAKKHSLELVRLCFGSFTSHESCLLYGLVSVLLLRTILSIVVADVDGHLVKLLINREKKQLLIGMMMWLGVAVPSSFANALIKYLTSRLSLALRAKLVIHTREKYFAAQTYYHVAQLAAMGDTANGGDTATPLTPASGLTPEVIKALRHPESVLTEDVENWADKFADLMSSIGKPIVDLAFFSGLLYHRLGFINQFTASVLVWESGNLMKHVRPDYGHIVQERGDLEAELRSKHTRIIGASEEIAFCHGEERERERLSVTFNRIMTFNQTVLNRQIVYHTIEDFVTKYLWSAIGMIQVAVPLMQSGTTAGDNAKYFITVRRIMIRNGDAVERCLAGIKDAIEFNGYTMKLANLLRGFDAVVAANQSKSHHTPDAVPILDAPPPPPSTQGASTAAAAGGTDGEVATRGDFVRCSEVFREDDEDGDNDADAHFTIILRNVPLRTPQGDVLAQKINLALRPGDRMLVLGPNGCGKSSLFRVLCGLWPHTEGYIKKPERRSELFFVPQKPYLVVGTFRDQIIYPDTVNDMRVKGYTDEDLLGIVGDVIMSGPLEAHGGLDAVKEWSEVLSGGEKQRLGLARVFYQRPKFAILDECSSAINVEAEQVIFKRLLEESMGLITISHRQTLFPFHNKLLTFDGEGGAQFEEDFQMDTFTELSEKKQRHMARLQRVLQDLGEAWPSSVQKALGQNAEHDD